MREATAETDLRSRVERHVRDWSVKIERTVETASSILIFGSRDTQPVVLKVIRHKGDEWRSGDVLDAFEGRGVVCVYAHWTASAQAASTSGSWV
jgi:hypothetical protein